MSKLNAVWSGLALAALLAMSGSVAAQDDAGPVGVVDAPCPPPLAEPPELVQAMHGPNPAAFMAGPPPPAVLAFLKERERRAKNDFAGLCRYQADDAQTVAAGKPPVAVFLGDSITEGWARFDEGFFAANGFVGRGIGGQTTAQALLRFQPDVAALHPRVVHILIGTNDIAGNGGPTTYAAIQDNITAMLDLARANGIRVVIGAIPPAADFPWRRGLEPSPKIARMNAWIAGLARRPGVTVADYTPVLADANGGFRAELSIDGVHPNPAGYKAMEPVAQAAIAKALASGGG